jgi:hypothetical protein
LFFPSAFDFPALPHYSNRVSLGPVPHWPIGFQYLIFLAFQATGFNVDTPTFPWTILSGRHRQKSNPTNDILFLVILHSKKIFDRNNARETGNYRKTHIVKEGQKWNLGI